MMRARVGDALLAALALLVAAWPLNTLLQPSSWVRPTLLLVLLATLLGMVGRAAGLRGYVVFLGQFVLVCCTAMWVFLGSHLWYGLPTWETWQDARGLIEQTVHVVTHFAAPAPTTPGVIFVVATAVGLLATVIDYFAVTRRAPALTGLPLLVVFLVSAANSGSSLNPFYFLALAFVWLILLARQGSSLLARWSSTDATPTTPTRDIEEVPGVAGNASVARALGVCTLVLAIAVPAFLPHLPPHYFADGLGRSANGSGGTGTVGFTQTLDLTADLSSQDTTPVITYRTNDPIPAPLRVMTTSRYDGRRWLPETVDPRHIANSTSPKIKAPAGLASSVGRDTFRITVTSNRLNAPHLAVPSPLAGADLDKVKWGLDPDDRSVLVDHRPSSYRATFWQIGRDVEARDFPDGLIDKVLSSDPTALPGVTPEDLTVDPSSHGRVSRLADHVVGQARTPLGKAVKIQDYLRDPSRFSYSLTLAPPRRDSDGDLLDPISHFLVTKEGYCTQFATAMVMMARAQGIPARMAIGFLPGTEDGNGRYTVTEADAHAWPELYLPDLGWTRFEPTPAVRSGEPPDYTEQAPSEPVPGGRPEGQAQANPPVPRPDQPGRDISPHLPNDSDLTTAASTPQPWTAKLPWVGAGVVLLLLGGLVVPLAGRYRRRHLAGADPVEAEWAAFSSRMTDYGIPEPGGRTPRQLQRYYRQHTHLDERATEAMGRALQTLERSRYAVPTDEPLNIGADTGQVLHEVMSSRSWTTRLRAALWPRSGREQLQLWTEAFTGLVTRPAKALEDRVDRVEARQRRRRARSRR